MGRDKPRWMLGPDGDFYMGMLKNMIEEKIVGSEEETEETRWSNLVPKKIGVFARRTRIGRLPCRETLGKMGLNLDSLLCPRCKTVVESVDHTMFQCEEVHKMWTTIAKWWGVDLQNFNSINSLLDSGNGLVSNDRYPKLWSETVWIFTYLTWAHRNRIVFEKSETKLEDHFFEFQRKTYEWVANRCRNKRIDWVNWLLSPKHITID